MIGFQQSHDTPLDSVASLESLTDQCFAADGWLVSALGLEHRPQQAAMAQHVAKAFANDSPLLCEAGTGVGKSLAYLIPGVMHAINRKRPLVVASHTIALQQQLLKSDLPRVRSLFEAVDALQPYRDFKATLLVGRGNYLCGHRLGRALSEPRDLFGEAQEAELHRIAEWAQTTQEGLRDELRPLPQSDVWEWVNADSTSCNRKNCTPETCFFRKALARRNEANVIVVNHALLFSLLAAGMRPGEQSAGILFPDDFVVLDEAHTVPAIATDHFGLSVSSYSVDRALKRCYHPRHRKGLLVRLGNTRLQQLTLEAIAEAERFFNAIRAEFLDTRRPKRLMKPNWIEARLDAPLSKLIRGMKARRADLESEDDQAELTDQAQALETLRAGIEDAITLAQDGHVYWLEAAGRQQSIVQLRSAPLTVAESLREQIFSRDTSCVLTSATLASGSDMSRFSGLVGGQAAAQHIESSPFDYERCMEIHIAQKAPEPVRQGPRVDIDYQAATITQAVLEQTGGTLVLLTSYADLRKIEVALAPAMRKANRLLLAQGGELSRAELKEQFVQAGNGVLLGADSFWTGFDVPGPALSQVILTRLPFEVPTHPVAEARAEAVRAQGGNPFLELTLPDAVVKFRQGIGRLIRNHSDHGRLMILDSRVLTKTYGGVFLGVLPVRHYTRI